MTILSYKIDDVLSKTSVYRQPDKIMDFLYKKFDCLLWKINHTLIGIIRNRKLK